MAGDKKTTVISFKTSSNVKAALEAIAEQDDRTVSYVVDKIVKEYLTRESKSIDRIIHAQTYNENRGIKEKDI